MIGRSAGEVVAIRAGMLEATLPFARVGDGVRIGAPARASGELTGRVVALRGAHALLAPFGSVDGVASGDPLAVDPAVLDLPFGTMLLGRAIGATGSPLDGRPRIRGRSVREPSRTSIAGRRPCARLLCTGVRAIDGPLAFGRGARIGVFGGPGSGKSTLLDAVVSGTDADAVVVGLIGERGREAKRRISALDARTTVVCATSDRSPGERLRAAEVAFLQAEALRARGLDVLLAIDSLARICAAARETALGAGEPPGRGGYPASVFGVMAKLVERAGSFERGSITLVASVLSDGADEHDPVSEAARAALDGHVVLSERLARAGRFPAIDVPKSTSRTFAESASEAHLDAARTLRAALASLDDSRDARSLGLDVAAGDPFLARCIACEPEIERFLRQDETPSLAQVTLTELVRLADSLHDRSLC